MGDLSRRVFLGAAALAGLSYAADSSFPELSFAQAKKAAAPRKSRADLEEISKSIWLKIRMRHLDEEGKKLAYGLTEEQERQNEWKVGYAERKSANAAILLPAHPHLLHQGFHNGVIAAVVDAVPQMKQLGFYGAKQGRTSLDELHSIPVAGLPAVRHSYLMNGHAKELEEKVQLVGLEDAGMLEAYMAMQLLAGLAESSLGKTEAMQQIKKQADMLYAKIFFGMPDMESGVAYNTQKYGEFMRALNSKLKGLERVRAEAAAKNIAAELAQSENTRAKVMGVVWDPLYMEILHNELAKIQASVVTVNHGFSSDYWTYWRQRPK